jgi:hypothetical protein
MQIEDQFRVSVPVEEAWPLLLDIERIAPSLPGAQLQEIEGEEFRGAVKVKVGPITAQYKGTARLEEVDAAAHTAIIAASGRDTRGAGNASATIRVSLEPDAGGTRVRIDTDLSVTGKVAQFGRGVLADVSAKLLAQFAANLERDVLGVSAEEALELEEADAGGATEIPGPGLVAPPELNGERAGVSAIRRIDSPEAEPVDLLAVSGAPLGKRLLPVLALVAVVVVVLGLRRRRRVRRSRGDAS